MGAGLDAFLAGALTGIEPEPTLTVSEWADRYRKLSPKSSAFPGVWRTDMTPYSREIMDCLSTTSPIQVVVFQKGAQIGGTEIANNFLGYAIAHAPGPSLFVLPDLILARDVSRQRLEPMFRECPELASKVRKSRRREEPQEQSVLTKEFPGGFLKIVGANAPAAFRMRSFRYCICDDADGYSAEAGQEGDVIELVMRRTATFKFSRKVMICSTPTLDGISRIAHYYAMTDQRQALVPCPFCGSFQTIDFDRIDKRTASLRCIDCEKLIDEAHKSDMLSHLVWTPTQESSDPLWRGYQLSALYSPPGWYSWRDAVQAHEKAERSPAKMQVFVNTVLGLPYADETTATPEGLMARSEKYEGVPRETLVITAGVDVQDNRVEVEVVGWGADEESWGLSYVVIPGDPTGAQLWRDLETFLLAPYRCGKRVMRIKCVLIDSGAFTKHVYRFTAKRWRRRWFPSKGIDDGRRPIAELSRRQSSKREAPLVIVGTVQGRKLVYDRLKQPDPSSLGYCHFPVGRGYTRTYFDQLTSFKPVRKVDQHGVAHQAWHLAEGARKEAFDCRLYATAALYVLPSQDWTTLQEKARKVDEPPPPTPEPEPEPEAPKPRTRRRTGGGWVTGWK